MFSPTDVVVTVRQARNLLIKGKGGLNDAYATIELFKEKYLTSSVKSLTPKWFTECTFTLPQGGVLHSKVIVIVHVYHKRHGKLGLEPDEFLGQIQIPLSALNSSDNKERSRWYTLTSKKKDSKKERGEIEVAFRFVNQQKNIPLPGKKDSPKNLRILTSGIRNKLRRRSEDEDSGVGISDGDRSQGLSLGKGRSYENLTTPSLIDSQHKPFERTFRTSSTNSSPGALHSARGSARLLQANNNLASKKAMSVEVLHRPEIRISGTSLHRSNSGGSGGNLVKQIIKQHTRNRSMPDSQLVTMMGQLRKDSHASKSAVCVNGSHLYVPGAADSGNNSITASPEVQIRSSSLEDVAVKKSNEKKPTSPKNKNSSNSSRRHSMADLDNIRTQGSALSALYKPKNYYRLDVKELRKVSTIHEDRNPSFQTMTHEELVKLATRQQEVISSKDTQIRELEDYIDCLLVKVMVLKPQILDGSLTVCEVPASLHNYSYSNM